MTRCASLLVAALATFTLAGCGRLELPGSGPDRSALASQTVQTYWNDIGQGKVNQAYDLMTSGNKKSQPREDYDSNMLSFLSQIAGVHVKTGKPSIDGDMATVPIRLYSPKSPVPLKAYQHLFWESGGWRISDAKGGLSQHA